ncbi:hypothetical protein DCS_02312 [Drechmeria coniospora]|uniref:Uncharacterized protein n=1 Tax=Drechmeria coniospora TaxID=98403 RepID=A0A151GVS7_DRECN|nr:hypothetical protein DCS_02312 [Drechmeria coniospora]KYK61171.1 hypothetical protein DCS_02312 [Drechmeria coniospora]
MANYSLAYAVSVSAGARSTADSTWDKPGRALGAASPISTTGKDAPARRRNGDGGSTQYIKTDGSSVPGPVRMGGRRVEKGSRSSHSLLMAAEGSRKLLTARREARRDEARLGEATVGGAWRRGRRRHAGLDGLPTDSRSPPRAAASEARRAWQAWSSLVPSRADLHLRAAGVATGTKHGGGKPAWVARPADEMVKEVHSVSGVTSQPVVGGTK